MRERKQLSVQNDRSRPDTLPQHARRYSTERRLPHPRQETPAPRSPASVAGQQRVYDRAKSVLQQ